MLDVTHWGSAQRTGRGERHAPQDHLYPLRQSHEPQPVAAALGAMIFDGEHGSRTDNGRHATAHETTTRTGYVDRVRQSVEKAKHRCTRHDCWGSGKRSAVPSAQNIAIGARRLNGYHGRVVDVQSRNDHGAILMGRGNGVTANGYPIIRRPLPNASKDFRM